MTTVQTLFNGRPASADNVHTVQKRGTFCNERVFSADAAAITATVCILISSLI